MKNLLNSNDEKNGKSFHSEMRVISDVFACLSWDFYVHWQHKKIVKKMKQFKMSGKWRKMLLFNKFFIFSSFFTLNFSNFSCCNSIFIAWRSLALSPGDKFSHFSSSFSFFFHLFYHEKGLLLLHLTPSVIHSINFPRESRKKLYVRIFFSIGDNGTNTEI